METQLTVFQKNYQTIGEVLKKNARAIRAVAASHLDAEKLTKLALTEFRRTPALALCHPMSVVASVVQAAQLGLEIGGLLGRAYLVPFKNKKKDREECQLIIGYRGMIELAYRSGRVLSVEGDVVYEGDYWRYQAGINRTLEHKPCGEDDPGKIIAAYAIIRMANGGVIAKAMDKLAIDRVRAKSPGGYTGPWVDFYSEMAVKTVIRRIFKFCPASTEIAQAVAFEEMSEAGYSATEIVDVEETEMPEPPVVRPKKALDKLVERAKAESRDEACASEIA